MHKEHDKLRQANKKLQQIASHHQEQANKITLKMRDFREENRKLRKQTDKAVGDLEKLEVIVYGPKPHHDVKKKKNQSSKSHAFGCQKIKFNFFHKIILIKPGLRMPLKFIHIAV